MSGDSSDLTSKSDIDRDWQGYLFVAYTFGDQKGSPIDVALDKNNPIAYPKIVRKIQPQQVSSVATPLTISPTTTTAGGCNGFPATFTASGGVPPYSWSDDAPDINDLVVLNATQAEWADRDDDFCSGGTVIVTVTDSVGSSASATINVLP